MTFGWYDGRPCRSTCPTRRMSFCSPLWLMPSAAPDASAKAAETIQIENFDVVMDSSWVSAERRRPLRPNRDRDRLRQASHDLLVDSNLFYGRPLETASSKDEIHERRPGVVTRLHLRCHNTPPLPVLVFIMDDRATAFTQNRPRLYGIA